MSGTKRWWHDSEKRFKMRVDDEWLEDHPNLNPKYYGHEDKEVRTRQHRNCRHSNKILLKQVAKNGLDHLEKGEGLDVEKDIQKTQGWETY